MIAGLIIGMIIFFNNILVGNPSVFAASMTLLPCIINEALTLRKTYGYNTNENNIMTTKYTMVFSILIVRSSPILFLHHKKNELKFSMMS